MTSSKAYWLVVGTVSLVMFCGGAFLSIRWRNDLQGATSGFVLLCLLAVLNTPWLLLRISSRDSGPAATRSAIKSIVLSIVVLSAVLWIFQQFWSYEPVELFSLGGFLVNAMLLPVAVISFSMAVDEFGKTGEKPDLRLYWGESKSTELSIAKPAAGTETEIRCGCPTLMNEGRATALWYLVEIRLPKELGSEWVRILGEDSNWQEANVGKEWAVRTFMSNGRIAAYPHCELYLGEVRFSLSANREYPRRCFLPYKVATSEGQYKEDVLRVRFR